MHSRHKEKSFYPKSANLFIEKIEGDFIIWASEDTGGGRVKIIIVKITYWGIVKEWSIIVEQQSYLSNKGGCWEG